MDLQALFETPDQYLVTFEQADALLVEMDRAAYHRSIFLDRRMAPKSTKIERVRAASLYDRADQQPPPDLCFIFHVAHCGSTLLARALDVVDANLVCREPMTLRQLGVQAAGSAPLPQDWAARLRLATALLNRRYAEAGPVIVKANVPVNFMLTELMALNPRQPAILLYATLENYLLAILRSPDHQRWVQHVTGEVGAGIERRLGAFERDRSLAATAAQLWLAQLLAFDELLNRSPSATCLDAEDFFNQPRQSLAAAFKLFGQTRSDAEIESTIKGELFSRYSKNPQLEFSNESRLGQREEARAQLQDEIAAAREWIERQPAFARLPRRLQRPLVGAGGALVDHV